MKYLLAGAAVLFAVAGMNAQSKKEKSSNGWTKLFDGKTTNGWHTYGKATVTKSWKVEDGAIHLDSKEKIGGDLVTDEEFENYDLKLEWKVSQNGNSGIIFNVHEDTAKYKQTYQTGPEMQIIDNDGHKDAKIHKHRAGDLYDMIASSSEPVKAVGEWNQAEIKVLNGKLDLYLNGVHVVSTTMWDDNWKQLIDGSKFKTWPGFGTYKKGHIALQNHGDDVWFRNIEIKKL